jgi:hypothetical protein
MLGQRHEIARLHSDFYRDKYHKILRWLMGSIMIIFALIIAIGYLILSQPPPSYYANTTSGKILLMPAAKTG